MSEREQVLCRHCGQPIGGGGRARTWYHLGRMALTGAAWCDVDTMNTLAEPRQDEEVAR